MNDQTRGVHAMPEDGDRSGGGYAPGWTAALLLLVVAACVGCAVEQREWSSSSTPPWIMEPPRKEDQSRHYVGIALATNVLDEAGGRRKALANAAELVAQSLAMDVESTVSITEQKTGAAHRGEERSTSIIREEVTARTAEIVRGLEVDQYYYERWKVREHFLGSKFFRYKYYVLTAYPEAEYQRVLRSALETIENRLDVLILRMQDALEEALVEDAVKCADRMTLRYPDQYTAWMAAARAYDVAEDPHRALSAVRKARDVAKGTEELTAAPEAVSEAEDKLARYLVREALGMEEGDTAACLRTMEEAWRTASTRSLRSSISRQYYEAVARSAAAQAMKTAEAKEWKKLAVSTFLESPSHTRAETDALREAVSRHLRAFNSSCSVILLEIDRNLAAEVAEGRWPIELRENLARDGVDGLVLGCADEEISLRLGEVRTGQTVVLCGGRSLEAIQGRPELPIWKEIDTVIPRNEASSFSVAVWTSQKEYRTGTELEVHFRASRDCHVYLVDVQTSGGMYLLFPNSYHTGAVVQGGKEYVVPGPDDEFAIQVTGPSGWEGLKIIASEQPMDIRLNAKTPFISVKDAGQTDFVRRLGDGLHNLEPREWAEASWAFFVSDREK